MRTPLRRRPPRHAHSPRHVQQYGPGPSGLVGRVRDTRLSAVLDIATRAALLLAAVALALVVLPRLAGYTPLIVRSGSMGDAAPVGSVAICRPIDPDQVRVGRVILIHPADPSTGTAVLHRVIAVEHTADGTVVVRTKGDANPTADPTSHQLRRATLTPVYHLPYLGYVIASATTPVGWLLLIGLPLSVLLASWLGIHRLRPGRWRGRGHGAGGDATPHPEPSDRRRHRR